MYENSFVLEDFERIKDYWIKYKDIKVIYHFLIELFNKNRDTLIKDSENKIIIKVKFPCGLNEEEISLEIPNKELSLDNTLKNLQKSVQILNKENKILNESIGELKNTKNQNIKNEIYKMKNDIDNFKKEIIQKILLKVYPVGSYYWSHNKTSPQELFGGRWESIQGKFIFAIDANHTVGVTGGEEKHTLTINEMPNHSYGREAFARTNHRSWSHNSSGSNRTLDYRDDNPYSGTYSAGGGKAHNYMPPYLCAYWWKRIS